VFVGFNRRFAPMLVKARDHIAGRGPVEATFRVSSPLGFGDHWLDDPVDGGGRLIGEGCHFVDLACWLVDDLPSQVSALSRPEPEAPLALARRFSIALGFADGSLVQILYGASVAEGLGKERYEFSAGGRTALVNDFDLLELHDGRKSEKQTARVKDKGHGSQFKEMRRAIDGRADSTLGLDPLATMAVTLDALESASGRI
jgi:polar amino acid transport system substrate-binding protein